MGDAETHQNPLSQLAADLLHEPFAQICGLAHMTLEQASELFSTNMEELDEAQTASFERSKAIFCMMLLEMEHSSPDWLTRTLGDLGGVTPTKLQQAVPMAPPESPQATESSPANPLLATIPLEPSSAVSSQLRCPAAQEHLWAAHRLAGWGQDPQAQAHHEIIERIACQQLCFAVELETQTRLAVALSQFAQRRGEVHRILFGENGNVGPSADLQKALHSLSELVKSAGKENSFDLSMITYALRYLSLSSSADLSRPSMIELGVFLVFFCGSLEHTTWAHASVDVPGLDIQQRLELGLHLIRLQTLRNHTLNVYLAVTYLQSEEIRRRCETCFGLLALAGNGFQSLQEVG